MNEDYSEIKKWNDTEGKKKKKKTSNLWLYQNCKHTFLCPAIHRADLVTKFSKTPLRKKKAFTAQGSLSGGWEEAGWDKPRSSSASPRRGQVTSSSSGRCSTALGSRDLSRDDGHCEEATPRVLRRQRQPCPTSRVDTLLSDSQRDLLLLAWVTPQGLSHPRNSRGRVTAAPVMLSRTPERKGVLSLTLLRPQL